MYLKITKEMVQNNTCASIVYLVSGIVIKNYSIFSNYLSILISSRLFSVPEFPGPAIKSIILIGNILMFTARR